MISTLISLLTQNYSTVIRYLPIAYVSFSIFVLSTLGSRLSYQISNLFGELAVIFYIVTLLPGMSRRFSLQHPIVNLLRLYRRQIGIFMYLFAFAHFFIKKYPSFISGFSAPSLAELSGIVAIFIFFLLFVTSNNTSQKLLASAWFVVQKLTYVGMFFIFLHLAFAGSLFWSILMITAVFVQVASFLFQRRSS